MKREFIENKKVLMRVDYNVPIENSVIQDIYRISKTIPMIKFCLDNKIQYPENVLRIPRYYLDNIWI